MRKSVQRQRCSYDSTLPDWMQDSVHVTLDAESARRILTMRLRVKRRPDPSYDATIRPPEKGMTILTGHRVVIGALAALLLTTAGVIHSERRRP